MYVAETTTKKPLVRTKYRCGHLDRGAKSHRLELQPGGPDILGGGRKNPAKSQKNISDVVSWRGKTATLEIDQSRVGTPNEGT